MHQGCSGRFETGAAVVDKLRMMGYSSHPMPESVEIGCQECGQGFSMTTFEAKCPRCGMVYGVTPCHAADPASIQAAGVDY